MVRARPLRREQLAVLITLAVLTAAAWVLTLSQIGSMAAMGGSMESPSSVMLPADAMNGHTGRGGMPMDAPGGSLEPGIRLLLFLGMWTTMMAAMMLPAATPMILVFGAVYRKKRERGDSFIPTWVFVAGYLIVWTGFGAYAWGMGEVGENLARAAPVLGELGPRLAAAAMLAAAAYQFTPLKQRCLSHCRSPLAFVMHHWRPGIGGALRMGAEHGVYCVGCRWVLFILLVVVGLASLPWMGLITLIVIAEKVLPQGRLVSATVAALLLGLSLLTFARPDLFVSATGAESARNDSAALRDEVAAESISSDGTGTGQSHPGGGQGALRLGLIHSAATSSLYTAESNDGVPDIEEGAV